jgi:uncharacterized protein
VREADAARSSRAGPGRDRDAGGRARNARPRDALGRPLPRNAAGEPPTSDTALPPVEALAEAQRLLDGGRPFHAHEVLEAAWKAAPDADRDLWQGLAQIAVGLTHALRGNARGAAALLRRGISRLDGYPDHGPDGIDVAGLRAHCTDLARRIESGELASLDPGYLAVRLRAES